MSFFRKIYSSLTPQALQLTFHGIMAGTGVTHVIQTGMQDRRKAQRDAAEDLEQKQRMAALEERVRQLEQAKAAPSGWFSGWR